MSLLGDREYTRLTEGPIARDILLFAVPLLLTNILEQAYNTVDLLIVSRYASKAAFAGVGSTTPFSNMLIGLFMGVATGTSVKVAQYFGAENPEKLRRTVHSSLALAILGGLILTGLGYYATPWLLKVTETPESIFIEAQTYLQIFFLGMVPLLVYNLGAGILRAVGDSRRPFFYLLVSAITNVGLDLLMVKYWGLGARGAAYATVVAQVVAAILVIFHLVFAIGPERLYLRDIRLHGEESMEIIWIGLPAGLQSVVISLSNVLIQAKINGFGPDAIGGVAIEWRLDGFVLAAIQAMGLAVTTFSAQHIGAHLYQRLRKGARVALGLSFGITFSLGMFLTIFAEPLVGFFTSDPGVLWHGKTMLYVLAPFYFIMALSETYGGLVRGAGKAFQPMMVAVLTMCVFRIFWISVILPLHQTFFFMIIGYPISWLLALIMNGSYYGWGKWVPGGMTFREYLASHSSESEQAVSAK